jgi:formate hydrogenlyase subunit 4
MTKVLVISAYLGYTICVSLSANYSTVATCGIVLIGTFGLMYCSVSSGNSYNLLSPAGMSAAGIMLYCLSVCITFGIAAFWYGVLKCVQAVAGMMFSTDILLHYFTLLS